MRYISLFIVLLISITHVRGQEQDFNFVSKMMVNETVTKERKGKKETIRFLGCVFDSNGKPIYKVLTINSKIPASKVEHGNSQVIFLNTKNKVVKGYNLSLPEELPTKLEAKKLFFNNIDRNGGESVYTFEVGVVLPKFLCVAPDDCY